LGLTPPTPNRERLEIDLQTIWEFRKISAAQVGWGLVSALTGYPHEYRKNTKRLGHCVLEFLEGAGFELDGHGLGRKPLFFTHEWVLAKALGLGRHVLCDHLEQTGQVTGAEPSDQGRKRSEQGKTRPISRG